MFGFEKKKKRTHEVPEVFGFEKKKSAHEVSGELLETKDCLMRMVAAAIDIYSATMFEYLAHCNGITKIDVEQELKRMLAFLKKYVYSEILIERARNGGKVTSADLAELR